MREREREREKVRERQRARGRDNESKTSHMLTPQPTSNGKTRDIHRDRKGNKKKTNKNFSIQEH